MGHNVTFIVGDFTALIGDTSDKESERPQISKEQIEENLKLYKAQAEKILDFSKIEIKFNSEWLGKLGFEDVVRLTQEFSLGDFISRELIKKRLNEGKRIGLHEVLYPVMQGYDSLHLDTDIQLGGTDQTFNMQAGRTLIKNHKEKESFVIANGFLSGTDGRKMSKTWGNAIWLTDSPSDMFGKLMSIEDNLIVEYFTLATDVPIDEIKEIENEIKKGTNPMQFKKRLARTITSMFHGDQKAEDAEEEFKKVVQEKQIPTDIETINISDGNLISKVLIEKNFIESNSEWKRLVEQNGVMIEDARVDNYFLKTDDISDGAIIKIGKRKYAKIIKSTSSQ